MLGNRGSPEALSRLCVMPSLLPHDLCQGWSSSRWLPAATCQGSHSYGGQDTPALRAPAPEHTVSAKWVSEEKNAAYAMGSVTRPHMPEEGPALTNPTGEATAGLG